MRTRYRLIMVLIPAILALYIVMLPLNRVIEKEHVEIFPFFSWRLFDSVPNAQTWEYGLILHSIDGNRVDEPHYLIPNDEIRDWKALQVVATACIKNVSCDLEVTEIIYPIVWRIVDAEIVEFSIIEARVDLHDVRDHIRDIVTEEISITDFFRPRIEIGRWNTYTGRVG